MAISRGLQPRQLYGLGSLVKSVTKGVKSAVKGVAKTVKKNPLLAAAAFNFAPMAFGKSPFLGLGSLKGSMGTLFGGAAASPFAAGYQGMGKKSILIQLKIFLPEDLI